MSKHTDTGSQDRLLTTTDELRETLEKYGVAIIPSVLDDFEIGETKKGFWGMLGQLTANFEVPIKENTRKSWKS